MRYRLLRLLLLALFLSHATAVRRSIAGAKARLRKLVHLHGESRVRDFCKTARDVAIENVLADLEDTNACLERRSVCVRRDRLRERLREARVSCLTCRRVQKIKKILKRAAEECAAVKSEEMCANKQEIKEELRELKTFQCRGPKRTTSQLARSERRLANKVRRRLKLPRPAFMTEFVEPNGVVDSAVILLHEQGDTVENVRALAVAGARNLNTTRFILPQARNITVRSLAERKTSWYQSFGNGDGTRKSVVRSARRIRNIGDIQREVYGIRPERVFVAGIGQGGAIALTTYLRHRWGATVVAGALLPIQNSYPDGATNDSRRSPLLMFHGTEDTVVPIDIAKRSRDVISKLGRRVKLLEFEREGHFLSTVQLTIVEKTTAFLQRRLNL